MYISRKIEQSIIRYLNKPEIIAIVGPRQCGKTTTLQNLYKTLENGTFLTFEDPQILGLFEHDIKQFVQMYVIGKKYLFIDEFQYAKNGGKLLKYLYDLYPIKIVISGSSSIDLTVQAVKFLVGRIVVIPMYPFDFSEFLLAKDAAYAKLYDRYHIDLYNPKASRLAQEQKEVLSRYFEEYALWGGYPRVVLAEDRQEKAELLRNLYNTYFLRDIRGLLGLLNDYPLSRLIQGLALQIGNLLSYQELASFAELTYPTLKKYLLFLDQTYIVGLIKPFYVNRRKEIVKNPRVYFFDTGLRNAVVNDFRGFEDRPDGGPLLENAVWMQLVRQNLSVQFWRDKHQNEVDFIIDLGKQLKVALEVKYRSASCRPFPLSFISAHHSIPCYSGYLVERGAQRQKGLKTVYLPLL